MAPSFLFVCQICSTSEGRVRKLSNTSIAIAKLNSYCITE